MFHRMASQGLHSVAYTGGLAKPLVAPPGVAARLTPPVLADFIANNYGAQRMVLAGEPALLRGARSCAAPQQSTPSISIIGMCSETEQRCFLLAPQLLCDER